MAKHTTLEERKLVIRLANQGLSNRQIAQQIGRSPYTVRKWRRRHRDHGEKGLHSSMGRPRKGTLSTFSVSLRQSLLMLRRIHPGWGPLSLLAALRANPDWKEKHLPSRSQIALFLKEQELVKPRQSHTTPPSAPKVTVTRPHMEWEMDAQVNILIPGLGRASIVNIVDVFTGIHVAALLCPNTRKPDAACYRKICRMAFSEFGLPERISLDHDTIFLKGAPSPFPSDFLLWLRSTTVKVRFITAPPPKEHARVEGRHALVDVQALGGRTFKCWEDVQRALDAQRRFTNAVYPVPKLGYKPRLEAFPSARHSGCKYDLLHEDALLDLEKAKAYLAKGKWYRQTNSKGQCKLGGRVYGLGKAWAGRRVEVTYSPEQNAFKFTWQDQTTYKPAKWLTKETLMAKGIPPKIHLTQQFPLPFVPPFKASPQNTLLGYDFSGQGRGTTLPD